MANAAEKFEASEENFNLTTERSPSLSRATDRLALGLGVFSIALGLSELVSPRAVARGIGAGPHDKTLRFFGAREIAAGMGLLLARRKAPYLWARALGDALDLSAMGLAFYKDSRDRSRLLAAIGAVAGVTLVDIYGSVSRAPKMA